LTGRNKPGLRIKADKARPEGMISGEQGAAADSVGRKFGFKWVLPATAFAGVGTATVAFNVSTPRETSIRIADRLGNRLIPGSNFLWLTYTDPDPRLAAQTLNTWANEYVRVAAELKKRKMVEFANILEGQLQYAENATRDAEAAYQNFRVNAITLPTEGGPVAAGLVGERDPALTSYFDQKIQYDNLRHDREALESNMANAARNGAPYEGLLLIPSVAQSPGAEGLREAFRTRYQLQARLAAERQHFTDEYATVKELKASLEILEKRTIPQLGYQLLSQMREREADYQRRIQSASRELQSIPPRTIEEHRLSRAVVVSEGLYTNLRSRYAEAKLAEASATPDISVLDTAVVPVRPTKKTTATVIILMAILAGLGAAGGLALLLDKLDGKFRYAHQAVSELGLVIAGAVPRIPKRGVGTTNPEQVVQFLESFRALRLHIAHTARGDRLRLAVTSAASGDGKSLVSSNLALSYSEAGLRTVLVDADTRRGSLHKTFGLKGKGGLTEYMLGKIPESRLLKETSHKNLSFISCGQRNGINPELLASPKLKGLIDQLAQQFDVVIVDTPPLAAGIDAYAISAATGNILMVVRMGHTERRLATAKLALLDRLPVYVLGSVMNDVPAHGDFQYYTAYSAAYALDEGPSTADLVEIGAQ